MRRELKWIAVFMTVSLILMALVACGNGSGNGSGNRNGNEKGQSGSSEKKTLDLVWFTDGNEKQVLEEILKDYEAKYPNITVNIIDVPFKDLKTKVKMMVAGGKPPALARIASADTGVFADQAIDLAEYIQGNKDEFISQYYDSIEPYYVLNGKIIAIPMDLTANGLIYNKTLFEKAGVKVPKSPDEIWTWEQFRDALKQVMEKGGAKYGLVMDVTSHRWSTMLYEFGGSFFSEDGTKAAINHEAGVKALEYFVKLHDEGIIPKSVWLGGENPNNLFRSGTVAAHIGGSWLMGNYKDISNFEWGVTYLPKEAQRSSVPGGKFILGFKGTGVEKETADLLLYLSSKEVNAKFNQESLNISPRKENVQLDYTFGKEYFQIFSDELNATPAIAGKEWARQDVMPQINNEIKDAVISALNKETTPQEAFNKLAELINKALAKE